MDEAKEISGDIVSQLDDIVSQFLRLIDKAMNHLVAFDGMAEELDMYDDDFAKSRSDADYRKLRRAIARNREVSHSACDAFESVWTQFPPVVWLTEAGEVTTEGPELPGDGYHEIHWDSLGI